MATVSRGQNIQRDAQQQANVAGAFQTGMQTGAAAFELKQRTKAAIEDREDRQQFDLLKTQIGTNLNFMQQQIAEVGSIALWANDPGSMKFFNETMGLLGMDEGTSSGILQGMAQGTIAPEALTRAIESEFILGRSRLYEEEIAPQPMPEGDVGLQKGQELQVRQYDETTPTEQAPAQQGMTFTAEDVMREKTQVEKTGGTVDQYLRGYIGARIEYDAAKKALSEDTGESYAQKQAAFKKAEESLFGARASLYGNALDSYTDAQLDVIYDKWISGDPEIPWIRGGGETTTTTVKVPEPTTFGKIQIQALNGYNLRGDEGLFSGESIYDAARSEADPEKRKLAQDILKEINLQTGKSLHPEMSDEELNEKYNTWGWVNDPIPAGTDVQVDLSKFDERLIAAGYKEAPTATTTGGEGQAGVEAPIVQPISQEQLSTPEGQVQVQQNAETVHDHFNESLNVELNPRQSEVVATAQATGNLPPEGTTERSFLDQALSMISNGAQRKLKAETIEVAPNPMTAKATQERVRQINEGMTGTADLPGGQVPTSVEDVKAFVDLAKGLADLQNKTYDGYLKELGIYSDELQLSLDSDTYNLKAFREVLKNDLLTAQINKTMQSAGVDMLDQVLKTNDAVRNTYNDVIDTQMLYLQPAFDALSSVDDPEKWYRGFSYWIEQNPQAAAAIENITKAQTEIVNSLSPLSGKQEGAVYFKPYEADPMGFLSNLLSIGRTLPGEHGWQNNVPTFLLEGYSSVIETDAGAGGEGGAGMDPEVQAVLDSSGIQ